MTKKNIFIAIAVLVAGASALYFVKDSRKQESDKASADVANAAHSAPTQPALTPQSRTASKEEVAALRAAPPPSDPRLAALMISPDNGFIEFVVGPSGKVIKEIDQNPTSLGFRKPSREYIYGKDKVIGLTAYQYFSDYTQVIQKRVSYKADGSVDQIQESTNYIYPDAKRR